jgi:hypothetical protein
MKPAPDDIRAAITNAETGNWIDSSVAPVCWHCILYDDAGVRAGDGNGHTAGEAMAMAWCCYWDPDALVEAHFKDDSLPPLEIPNGWKFELTVPEEARDGAAVDNRPFLPYASDEFRRVLRQAIKNNPLAVSLAEQILRAMVARDSTAELGAGMAAPAAPASMRCDPDPAAIAEVLLRDFRVPLAMQQAYIRHGLANAVAKLLVAARR